MRRLLKGRSGSNTTNPSTTSTTGSKQEVVNTASTSTSVSAPPAVDEPPAASTTTAVSSNQQSTLPRLPVENTLSMEQLQDKNESNDDGDDDIKTPPLQPQKPRGLDPPAPIAETGDSFRDSSTNGVEEEDDVALNTTPESNNTTSTSTSNNNHQIVISRPPPTSPAVPVEEVPHYTQMKYATSNGIESATSNRSNRTFSSVSSGGSDNHPDLSNLWRKKQASEGWYTSSNSNSYSGGGGGNGDRSAHPHVVRYPTVFEHAVQLPPIDSILTTTTVAQQQQQQQTEFISSSSSEMNRLLVSQPSSLSSSKEDTTQRATKPGAVAVMNTAKSNLPQQMKSSEAGNSGSTNAVPKEATINTSKTNTALHVSPVSFASIPTPSISFHISQGSSEIQEKVSLASDNSFWEKKLPSTITTVKSSDVKKSIPRQSSLQLDALYETKQLSQNRNSHSMVMMFDDEHIDSGKVQMERRLDTMIPTKPPRKTKSLLDDDDDDNNKNNLEREKSKQGSFGPPIWGKKTSKKSSLEDDMGPDSIELAFAEGITTTPQPIQRMMDDKKGPPRSQSDDDQELQAALQASQNINYDDKSDFELEAAILASKNENKDDDSQLMKALEVSSSMVVQTTSASSVRLSDKAIEDAKENAHSARRMIASGDVDLDFLRTVLDLCRTEQRIVAQAIEDAMFHDEINADLGVLIDLNNNILDVLEAGDRMIGTTNRYDDNYNVKLPPAKTNNLDVEELVEKHDIFSLICMLRVQMNEKRLDAAYALMKFSRAAEKNQDKESIMLRDEIRSSGGLHSLLTLFRVPDTSYELRAITALAVAYLVPALVESSSETPPSVGLRVVECLKYLSTVSPLSYRGELLSEDEMKNASTLALASLWVNHLESLISSNQIVVPEQSVTIQRGVPPQKERNRGGDQRREMVTIGELVDETVSLIMFFAKLEAKAMKENQDYSFTRIYTLVEHVCAIEVAQPIAVREGVLQALICWIQSHDRDRTRSACSALRDITSVVDKYMAGWIHSEMVNQGAVQCLAHLTQDFSLTREVRLSIAQILSSLCAAPHTRAAVVETNCINFLIGILYEHNDPSSAEVAIYAGRAILQLAAGAISRASAFVGDDVEPFGSTPIDKRDSLIGYVKFCMYETNNNLVSNRLSLFSYIVESGAVASFVSIAQHNNGVLRSIAIQALRVFSDDIYRRRWTRIQLCNDNAAIALGAVLKDNVPVLSDILTKELSDLTPQQQESSNDLYEALVALANILDPTNDGSGTKFARAQSSSSFVEAPHLIKGCLDTARSGGMESLLTIASSAFDSHTNIQSLAFVEEACRSLSSLAPLLLDTKVSLEGYSAWAHNVLLALHQVLTQIKEFNEDTMELQVVAINGISALAKSAPLKVRIIDRSLPYLLRAKNMANQNAVANAAGLAFQSLDLADDEVAIQVAGNARNIFVDWFCLNRSLLLQAMARFEIRRLLYKIWNGPFKSTDHGMVKLIREGSRSPDESIESGETELFSFIADDEATLHTREMYLSQYNDVYGSRYAEGKLNELEDENSASLLSEQTFPLESTDTEIKWILDHRRSIASSEAKWFLPDHVQKLLCHYFPSNLLRDDVIPLQILQPEASFNFRVFMMAQRQYFSFRREGQLLFSLCDKEAGIMDAHWSLGFKNSTFAGEFAESLVQVLYKCPMIRALTFSRNSDWTVPVNSDKDNNIEHGDTILANLIGSLPPWISHLTFDGIFGDAELRALVDVLESMGRLSEERKVDTDNVRQRATSDGTFWFLAISHSPYLSAEAWTPFFTLLGGVSSASNLTSLRSLDLSGNGLGDGLCGNLLKIVFDETSICRLEQLDLSHNRIGHGDKVFQELTKYAGKLAATKGSQRNAWKCSLHTLILAGNNLCLKRSIALIHNNRLEFKSLDLSGNAFAIPTDKRDYADIIVQTVSSNCGIERLNLSDNCFSHAVLDHMIIELSKRPTGFTILQLDKNTPSLTPDQSRALQSVLGGIRKRILQRHINDRANLLIDGDVSFKDAHSDITSSPSMQRLQSLSIPETHAIRNFPGMNEVSTERQSYGNNSITVLFSAPLVYTDGHTLRPFAKLDFDMERELMWQCLKEASRDIELSFDSATHDRLLATMTKRCSCLHYSGHGHQQYLPFEDGSGGPYWFQVNQFKSLIEREGGAPFRFVFVSACYSYLAGETFASAGVPHVVCCQQESELKDTAALAFTRQFYLALAIGHTVKVSFEQGCKAVRATPNLKDPDAEMDKFLLLPKDGNHDVPIFNAPSVPEWPKQRDDRIHRSSRNQSGRSFSRSVRSLGRSTAGAGARTSELSVRNMMQEDPSPSPPEFFMGREVDTYYVLKAVLTKRLVSVVGEPGIGRSSLVCALCHYINERASTMLGIDRIYFVRANRNKRNPLRSLVQRFLKKLIEEEKARPVDADAEMETMFDSICKFLKLEKVLVVFDHCELIVDADEANEFPLLLSKLCRETKNVKVLLTNRRDLGIPSLGEHPISLGPLKYADTVRLFANLCPYLHTPADRKKLFETLVKDNEVAEVLSTDPGIAESSTKRIFTILGDGIPSRIEKAAYDLTKEDFLALYKLQAS